VTIEVSGSYCLAGDLVGEAGEHGIVVAADAVDIDLMGFSLIGVPGSLDGIHAEGIRALSIRNGVIRDWDGEAVECFLSQGLLLEDLQLIENLRATRVSGGVVVRNCVASRNGDGFEVSGGGAVVSCVAVSNETDGFGVSSGVVVQGCNAIDNGSTGISASFGSLVTNCTSRLNGQNGMRITLGSRVENSVARGNTQAGISLGSRSQAVANFCQTNGSGSTVTQNNSLIDGNLCSENDIGSKLGQGDGHIMVRNFSFANTGTGTPSANYNFDTVDNTYGPIIGGPGEITSTNPWANLTN